MRRTAAAAKGELEFSCSGLEAAHSQAPEEPPSSIFDESAARALGKALLSSAGGRGMQLLPPRERSC